MLLTLDMYREPLPGFNIEGSTHVRTYCGGCITLIISLVLFMFSTLKLQHLLQKHNPVVNTHVKVDEFDEKDVWYGAEDEDFMMAFALSRFPIGGSIGDPKFIKWLAEYVILIVLKRRSTKFKTIDPSSHVCT